MIVSFTKEWILDTGLRNIEKSAKKAEIRALVLQMLKC